MVIKIPKSIIPARVPYMGGKNDISYSLIMAMHQRKPQAKIASVIISDNIYTDATERN